MEIDVKKALDGFLKDRKERFPNVTNKQKKEWQDAIEGFLESELFDGDVFYGCIPDDVIEADCISPYIRKFQDEI